MKDDKFVISQNQPKQQVVCINKDEIKEYKAEQKASVIRKSRRQSKNSHFKAFICALLSGFSFSLIGVLAKQSEVSNAAQNSIYFSTGVFVFTLPITIYEKKYFNMERTIIFFICLRGIFSAVSTFSLFIACRLLPLGEVTVIVFSSPVFVTIFARIFFKEMCSIVDIVTVILTFTGLSMVTKIPLIISQPEYRFSTDYFTGLLAAFSCLFCFTGSILSTRKAKSVHYSVVTIISTSISLIICCIINVFTGKFSNLCGKQYLPLAFGLLAFIGRITLVRAIQLYNAGPITTVRSCSDIAFAFLWQVTYFGENPDVYAVSGAVLVTTSALLIGLKIWIFNLSEESLVRKKTIFFMK